MKNPRVLFWLIVVITVLAVLIDIPKSIPININTTIPLINKKIEIKRTINGFNPDIVFRPLGIQRDWTFKKGLDLEGGTSITLQAEMKEVPQERRKEALDSAKTVVERRVNFFGVSEPVVQTATVNNDYRIIVELPGVTNVEDAVNLIGTTAQLTFWEEGASESGQMASPSAGIPLGADQLLGPNPKKTNLTGNDLEQTSVVFDPNTSQPQVQLLFTSEGGKKFAEITKKNLNKRLAIVIDNIIIEAPMVNQVITGGEAVITGAFNTESAKALSVQLNAGALPVPLTVVQQQSVGPSLGAQSLQKSLYAGILGFIIIVVFMSVLYRKLGIIASVALVIYAIVTLAIFKLIPITLTLAGIAGFILSVGMAVDANILIFERMKEELRRGRKQNVAIELGFTRAWSSIKDSNISTLITCIILYYFGTSIVRGFAITLAIGVLVSMFSAIIVTRTLLRIIYKN